MSEAKKLVTEALEAFNEAMPELKTGLRWGKDKSREGHFLDIRHRRHTYSFEILVKRHLNTTAAFDSLVRLTGGDKKTQVLLICEYIPRNTAALLKKNQMFFLDTAGNAFIHAGDLFIFLSGMKKSKKPSSQKVKRAFNRSGLKAIFNLLSFPEMLRMPYRNAAALSGVSTGSISGLYRELQEMGYLVYLEGGEKKLLNREVLFEKWIEAYSEKLRPTLVKGRFRLAHPEYFRADTVRSALKNFPGTFLGGEMAAQLLTRYLKAGGFVLYSTGSMTDLVKGMKLIPDAGGSVEVLEVFWDTGYYEKHWQGPGLPGLAPIPLVYADLLISGDERNLEGARIIYDDYLQNFQQ